MLQSSLPGGHLSLQWNQDVLRESIICVDINTDFSLLTQIPRDANSMQRVRIVAATSWHDKHHEETVVKVGGILSSRGGAFELLPQQRPL